jgi:hypothetical protein
MILAKTYQMVDNIKVANQEEEEQDYLTGCDEIHQSTKIDGLCTLTAYKNGSVKAQFLYRTIVRMHAQQEWVHILSSKGDEVTIRLS